MKRSRLIYYTILLGLSPLLFVVAVNAWVQLSTASQLYEDVSKIPKNRVGIVLGTAKYKDGAKTLVNTYYENRINAAVALYLAGKIDIIIVSGDNSTIYYNEPLLMKNDLIALGVSEEDIYLDNAGYRTLDSILRCRDIFGQKSFTIISQKFHNERAVFIANRKGVKVVAFNAEPGEAEWVTRARDRMARIKMLYDLIVNTQAKYYGDRVQIK